ncbi:hypothetical protein, partial [Nonomuraea basaltis]|uniref:hypothetical protein n=1 Tax=Nonomuraea basaltis TaxID=2495887 RepID=UPI001980D53C
MSARKVGGLGLAKIAMRRIRAWTRSSTRAAGAVVEKIARWIQLRLFEARRDFTRFDESAEVDLANPWLSWALYLAYRRGE